MKEQILATFIFGLAVFIVGRILQSRERAKRAVARKSVDIDGDEIVRERAASPAVERLSAEQFWPQWTSNLKPAKLPIYQVFEFAEAFRDASERNSERLIHGENPQIIVELQELVDRILGYRGGEK
jgi:hypothetical protein